MKTSLYRSAVFYLVGLLFSGLYLLLTPAAFHPLALLAALPAFIATRWLANHVHLKPVLLQSQITGHTGLSVLVWACCDPELVRILGNSEIFRSVQKAPFLPLYLSKGVCFHGHRSDGQVISRSYAGSASLQS